MFSDVYDISGAHCDEQIALLTVGKKIVLDLIKCREVFARSSKFLNTFLQILGRDAKSISLSRGLDISDYHVVCEAESFCKLRKQGFGTCICMRLEYTP